MYRFYSFFILILALTACQNNPTPTTVSETFPATDSIPTPTLTAWETFFIDHPDYRSDGFDYPVGKPDAKGYYNAQPYGENLHLGDDWNATTGGNSDLGHPIYSIANGYVRLAENLSGGWGKVVRVVHQLNDSTYVESLYAHCDSMLVVEGDAVLRGQQIATIGNADGAYYAHLHFEMRDSMELGVGGGYGDDEAGYLNPTPFIQNNRPK